MIDVILVDDKRYVNVDDFINHLNISAETVVAFTQDSAPLGAKMVSETLYATIETLENLKVSNEN
jgi:hypothetical protein